MKMLIIHGSARKNGNSSTLAKEFEKEASTRYTVENLYLGEKKISDCTGCKHCKRTGSCRYTDDMQPIYTQFKEADAVCFVSPVYWWGISSLLKTCIDRLYALNLKDFHNKDFYLIVTGSDSVEGIQYMLIQEQFKAICEYTGMVFAGYLPVSADDSHKAMDNEEALDLARHLIQNN
ncbi:flavodoxin family protein [uncultured Sphaerochaeta sp.]|uniref:flavodoxin family protein n=1 Tax=uncultured Sphaerochaeta sp. TaxID=886478 RepID=UPI002A0A8709|nr:flavodoxin family protein [uncultured Sphaerochaeta sp.]